MSESGRYRLGVVAVVLVGLAMRTLPLWRSPLPFRADGLFYAADASATVATGGFPIAGMATDDLGFTPLLAAASLVTGVDPWYVTQPVSSLVAAVPVLLVVALTRRLCRRAGWSADRARLAALLAGAFLAVEGLYLHRAMAADEQTVGLLVVPLALVALHRASRTDRTAWWVVGLTLLAILPPLHNLDAMVTAVALSALVVVAVTRNRLDRGVVRLVVVTVVFWVVFAAYHLLVERYTPAAIIQEARFTDVPGLVVAWVVLGALMLAWTIRARPRTHRLTGWATIGSMFGLITLNAHTAVFPEMPRTPVVVLALLVPLVLPASLAVWGGPDLVDVRGDGPALLALLAGSLALVGVSLTAALTPVYLGTAYRTSLFVHLPIAVPVGAGTVALMGSRYVGRRAGLRAAVPVVVLACAVVSAPLMFGGLAPFNYRAVTTPGEVAATGFAAGHVDGEWAADDHARRVAAATRPGSTVSWDPVYEWLVDGRPPPDCPTLVKRSWTTRGTQFLTTAPVRLAPGESRRWEASRSVVYDGGDRDRIRLGLRAGRAPTGC